MLLAKYRPRGCEEFVVSLLRSLAYLDDVQEDPGVPLPKAELGRVRAVVAGELAGAARGGGGVVAGRRVRSARAGR
jgi:hypothetical protein